MYLTGKQMAQRGTHKLRLCDQKPNLEWALSRDWTGSPPAGGDVLQNSGKENFFKTSRNVLGRREKIRRNTTLRRNTIKLPLSLQL